MHAHAYYEKHGRQGCSKVARRAKTNWPYFKQFVYGVRSPSAKLAKKLVVASIKETPETPLSLEGLLFPPKKNGSAKKAS